jgi:hypothetical protein
MQTQLNAIQENGFIPTNALVMIIAQAQLQQWFGIVVAKVFLRTPSRVIAVRVRNHGFAHWLPGVDVEIALLTVEAVVGYTYEGHFDKLKFLRIPVSAFLLV